MRGRYWHLAGWLLLSFSLVACSSVNTSVTRSPSPTLAATHVLSGQSLAIAPHATPAPSLTPDPTAPAGTRTPVPTPTSSALPTLTSVESQLEQQLFNLINQDRATLSGLGAYTLNSAMSAGALVHSWKMASCGLSHQCPGEADPCQRVTNEGISWTACGENVGYSSPSPTAAAAVQGIETDMLNEPAPAGHRHNLLSTSYHRLGLGIYIDSRGYVWITEDFAS